MLDVQLAVAKTNKYASRESGDTVEVVERPNGGFSVVLADGQGSGRAAKNLSHLVTTKAISMIKDGARDGAVARSVHDYLYTYRGGKVSASLVIISVDLASRTLVMSRNSQCPILISRPDQTDLTIFQDASEHIGIYALTKPVITVLPIEPYTYALTFSDGVLEAGKRSSKGLDIEGILSGYIAEGMPTARYIADSLLALALELDDKRPADDMSVLAISILPAPDEGDTRIVPQVRRMGVEMAI